MGSVCRVQQVQRGADPVAYLASSDQLFVAQISNGFSTVVSASPVSIQTEMVARVYATHVDDW